jgi:hypothetical protein
MVTKNPNRLTQINGTARITPLGNTIATFQCVCGNTKELRADRVASGEIKSCGCSWHVKWNPGDVFGHLTVIGISDRKTKSKHPYIRFRCECGTEKEIQSSNVLQGKIVSCGCSIRTVIKPGQMFGKLAAIRQITNNSKGSGATKWLFHCGYCNKEKELLATRVTRQNYKSCGCNIGGKGVPEKSSRSAKSPTHHLSLYWELIGPDGVRLEGFNLQELVRKNEHLFQQDQLNWKRDGCNATHGLYSLFLLDKNGNRKAKSYRGWTIGDKMTRELKIRQDEIKSSLLVKKQ